MKEFEFIAGSLEAQGLHEGDEVECVSSNSKYYIVGRVYQVFKNYHCSLFAKNEVNCFLGYDANVWFRRAVTKMENSDFQNALDYLDTFGIPAEITDKGMHIEGELTRVQWLDFAKILLEGEE